MKELRKFEVEMDVDSSKDKVWNVIFNEFGDVTKFNPLIDGSRHSGGQEGTVGAERVCQLDSKRSLVERIIGAEDGQWMEVEIEDGGMPMMDSFYAHFKLESRGDNSTHVTLVGKYETKPKFIGGMVKPMMRAMFTKLLVGLKYYVETGNEVSKSNFKQIAKHYKQLGREKSFANVTAA
jgi:hypothetical protein